MIKKATLPLVLTTTTKATWGGVPAPAGLVPWLEHPQPWPSGRQLPAEPASVLLSSAPVGDIAGSMWIWDISFEEDDGTQRSVE